MWGGDLIPTFLWDHGGGIKEEAGSRSGRYFFFRPPVSPPVAICDTGTRFFLRQNSSASSHRHSAPSRWCFSSPAGNPRSAQLTTPLHACTYMYMNVHACTCMHVHGHARTCMHIHVRACTYMYMHVRTCTYMYMHVHAYVHACWEFISSSGISRCGYCRTPSACSVLFFLCTEFPGVAICHMF